MPNLVQTHRGRAGARPRRPVRQHRARLQLGDRDQDGARATPTGRSPRPASASTSAPRSSSTSSAATPGSRPPRWCWWRPCARSSATAASRKASSATRRSGRGRARPRQPREAHREHAGSSASTPIVAINRFAHRHREEIAAVRSALRARSACRSPPADHFARGGEGAHGAGPGGDGARQAAGRRALHARSTSWPTRSR